MELPRFLLTAGASGSGKTLLTCGILQALKNRGLQVASFKCGPDYIDPMFHTKVIGTRSRNLDAFFAGENTLRYLLGRNSRGCNLAVIEGVMGYYDGVGGTTVRASAYDVARITDTPAVLIVNSRGMSLSIAAYIQGFLKYQSDSRIAGVILNQMSPMLYPRMKKLIEEQCGVKVYGYVPKVEDCVIESRHLGLVLPEEIEDLREKLDRLAGILENSLDLEGLLRLAGRAPSLSWELREQEAAGYWSQNSEEKIENIKAKRPLRIGLAKDEAFCFMYEDNLQLLKDMGAELKEFSPIHDRTLPSALDGLLLYGGYPELFGKELEENREMRNSLKKALDGGMPVMAECGGFLYLHESFEDMEGRERAGVGKIKGKAYKTPRLSRFGYITLEQNKKVFGAETGPCPAHEFHYFDSTNCGEDFLAVKPESSRSWKCIHADDTMLAGFPHFYYWGNPRLPKAFLEACGRYREKEEKR